MLQAVYELTKSVRRSHRQAHQNTINLEIPSVKLSFMDERFSADAWIMDDMPGRLALRLGDYDLAFIAGNAVDLPSLNQILHRFFHRKPRSPASY